MDFQIFDVDYIFCDCVAVVWPSVNTRINTLETFRLFNFVIVY